MCNSLPLSLSAIGAILACCAACFVGCIESLVEYFNRYAYIEIGEVFIDPDTLRALRLTLSYSSPALYGKPYIPAAKDTWRLFKDRGIDALINDSLVGITLNFGGYICGILAAIFAYVYLRGLCVTCDSFRRVLKFLFDSHRPELQYRWAVYARGDLVCVPRRHAML